MDKNRVAGSINEVKGAAKEANGKSVGDAKLQNEGKIDKAVGKDSKRRRRSERSSARRPKEVIDVPGSTGAIKNWREELS
jgi:uncharacterized protein YjbJ (UPF0337 family)